MGKYRVALKCLILSISNLILLNSRIVETSLMLAMSARYINILISNNNNNNNNNNKHLLSSAPQSYSYLVATHQLTQVNDGVSHLHIHCLYYVYFFHYV